MSCPHSNKPGARIDQCSLCSSSVGLIAVKRIPIGEVPDPFKGKKTRVNANGDRIVIGERVKSTLEPRRAARSVR